MPDIKLREIISPLSPSVLYADITQLGTECQKLLEHGTSWLDLDVMDGKFVPKISFGCHVINSISND